MPLSPLGNCFAVWQTAEVSAQLPRPAHEVGGPGEWRGPRQGESLDAKTYCPRGGGTEMSVQLFKQKDRNAKGQGHPIMFGLPEAEHFGPFPEGGGYPKSFLKRAYEILGVTDSEKVLHVCSGSMCIGVRVDVRPETSPTVVADARHLPFPDNSFEWVMADPPYSREYAENLYGTGSVYPDPGVLVAECLRVLRPGGRLGFMHHVVPKFKRPGRLLKVYAISQGPGYNIRAWTVLTKD